MRKILLVDDEPIMCEGLRLTVPWEECGAEVVGVAQDGLEALNWLEAHGDVDIILSDVRMPVMDGLEMAERLHKLPKTPTVILLSGYDDFEYARKAMGVGVKSYLLKPVEISELIETVRTVVEKINRKEQEDEYYLEMELRNIILGKIEGDERLFNQDNELLQRNAYFALSSKTDQSIMRSDSQYACIQAVLKQYQLKALFIELDEHLSLICIYQWLQTLSRLELRHLLKEAKKSNVGFIALNTTPHPISEVNHIYSNLRSTLTESIARNRRFTYVRSHHNPSNLSWNSMHDVPTELVDELIKGVFKSDINQIMEVVRKLIEFFLQNVCLLPDAYKQCQYIENKIVLQYEKLVRNKEFPIREFKIQSVTTYGSYNRLRQLLEEDMAAAAYFVDQGKTRHQHWAMESAIEYIQKYYASDIKASEVADLINLSPNYFSSLFKQDVGMSFNEYLNEFRIEKAKLLLEKTPDKVRQIASQVGYQEYKYFVQVFKKFTKVTPTEYRKILHGESSNT
ncbi:response regulator [Paenibacillus lautus]|uniref:response regulator transcription factor n=1 Tax=Paenibacillus lautus TaxID=1401 RepID=UPI003D2A33A7